MIDPILREILDGLPTVPADAALRLQVPFEQGRGEFGKGYDARLTSGVRQQLLLTTSGRTDGEGRILEVKLRLEIALSAPQLPGDAP